MSTVRTADFPADDTSVGAARAFVRELVHGHPRSEDAVLLMSEVTTNAVLHGSTRGPGTFRVIVRNSPAKLYAAVLDRGGGHHDRPALCTHGPDAEHGRGLEIVNLVASAWGVIPVDGGHRVWFELLARG